jgi:hypothetical protein
VECGRCVWLTILPPSMSWLSRQCGILNITQLYRPPMPVTGIALLKSITNSMNKVGILNAVCFCRQKIMLVLRCDPGLRLTTDEESKSLLFAT